MQKNTYFKIHKPRISIVLQSKGDKGSHIDKKKKEESSIMP